MDIVSGAQSVLALVADACLQFSGINKYVVGTLLFATLKYTVNGIDLNSAHSVIKNNSLGFLLKYFTGIESRECGFPRKQNT